MDGFGIFTFYFTEKKEPLRSGGNHSSFFYAETLAPIFVFHLKGLVFKKVLSNVFLLQIKLF